MIKYQYAKDEKGNLIDIYNLDVKDRTHFKFFCIGCGNELIARIGKIKVPHFSHKKVDTCSGETYLHLLGKQLFYDNYIECLNTNTPFEVEFYQARICNHYEQDLGVKCELEGSVERIDLTQYFDKISIEEREDSFIADVMLTSKSGKDKIFIEIAVTHLSTEKKINSKYRIIEIEIDSEEDFEPIKRKFLSETNPNIKFKNFKPRQINCNGDCKEIHNFLTLDKEGKCLLTELNLKQIKKYFAIDKEKIVKYEIFKDGNYDISSFPSYSTEKYINAIATFAEEKIKIRNCLICRYHAYKNTRWLEMWRNIRDGVYSVPIFCNFLKTKCDSNEAVTCRYFRLEKKKENGK